MNILLVEDSETDIYVIREVLKRCGFEFSLRIARDGYEALNYLRSLAAEEAASCPALVLLDLNLPKISGLEVLRQLHEGSPCPHGPVIVITSSDSDSDRNAVNRLGAAAYFRKPADLDEYMELAQLVQQFVSRERNES